VRIVLDLACAKSSSLLRVCRPITSLACVLSACNNLSPSASSNRQFSDVERGTFATSVVTQTDNLLEAAALRVACRKLSMRRVIASELAEVHRTRGIPDHQRPHNPPPASLMYLIIAAAHH
jgi:hypothetical protein